MPSQRKLVGLCDIKTTNFGPAAISNAGRIFLTAYQSVWSATNKPPNQDSLAPSRPEFRWQPRTLTLQEARESGECDVGDVMLDALRIEFRALLGDTDGAQKIDDEPMPGADAIGKTMPLRRQEHAAIEL